MRLVSARLTNILVSMRCCRWLCKVTGACVVVPWICGSQKLWLLLPDDWAASSPANDFLFLFSLTFSFFLTNTSLFLSLHPHTCFQDWVGQGWSLLQTVTPPPRGKYISPNMPNAKNRPSPSPLASIPNGR